MKINRWRVAAALTMLAGLAIPPTITYTTGASTSVAIVLGLVVGMVAGNASVLLWLIGGDK